MGGGMRRVSRVCVCHHQTEKTEETEGTMAILVARAEVATPYIFFFESNLFVVITAEGGTYRVGVGDRIAFGRGVATGDLILCFVASGTTALDGSYPQTGPIAKILHVFDAAALGIFYFVIGPLIVWGHRSIGSAQCTFVTIAKRNTSAFRLLKFISFTLAWFAIDCRFSYIEWGQT